MRFLLDENFPKAAISFLTDLGHEVLDFRNEGVEGAHDADVMALAFDKRAVILTTDRDFFHTLSSAFPQHHGIVVIALKRPTRDTIIGRLRWLLSSVATDSFSGRAFQLRDRAWMAFPPLE